MGETVSDGIYNMQFFLFDAPTGGNQIWNPNNGEVQEVVVTGGIYDIQLGAVQPLDSSIFEGGTAWLEVVIFNLISETWETLSPRQLITATAYSLKAGDADTLAGASVSDFASGLHNHDGEDITGGTIDASFIDGAIARDAELTWGNIGGVPADISDGDDVGITTEADPTVTASVKDGVTWTELTGIPSGFADNVDDVGLIGETDPQVGTNTANYVPRFDGSALVKGSIYDNGFSLGIGTSSPSSKLEIEAINPLLTLDTTNVLAGLRFQQNASTKWQMAWNADSQYLYF